MLEDRRRILAIERARATIASFETVEASSDHVFAAFAELDALPEEVVREALESWSGPLPDPARLDDATRRAHGMPPRPLRLCTLDITRDADILDLGSVAEEQLRLAGTSWDGVDLAPEERLDGELEGSLAGTVERRVLADQAARSPVPLFDAILFAGDAGIVFSAGTTKVVALVAYGKVEARDRHVRAALEEALASTAAMAPRLAVDEAPPVEVPPAPEVTRAPPQTETAAPKKAAPKKAAPRKAAPKKAAAPRKTAPKKAATPRKAAPKKTTATPKRRPR